MDWTIANTHPICDANAPLVHAAVMYGAGSGQGYGNYLPFINPLSKCHIPRCLSLCHFNYHPSTPSDIFILHLVNYYPVRLIIIQFQSIITQRVGLGFTDVAYSHLIHLEVGLTGTVSI